MNDEKRPIKSNQLLRDLLFDTRHQFIVFGLEKCLSLNILFYVSFLFVRTNF